VTSSEALREATATQIRDRVNRAITEGVVVDKDIRILAAKQLKSGDVVVHTARPENTATLIRHSEEWVYTLGSDARVLTPMYGVLMHNVSTSSVDTSDQEIVKERLKTEFGGSNRLNCTLLDTCHFGRFMYIK
jgi:hypothetical protein